MVHVLLKPDMENFKHHFTSVWDECNCAVVWAFFGIAFLWDWNESWPFPVLWPLVSFPHFLAYWMQHFHSIIFQDLKQLNGNSITSTSFVCSDAFKGPLDFTFQMSGSRWVLTPSWLSGSWRTFFYSSTVYRRTSLVVQLVKNPSAMKETWVQSLGWEDPLEKGKTTHSSILAWRIPWNL